MADAAAGKNSSPLECLSIGNQSIRRGKDMDNKKLGFGLLGVTGVCWIVTTIGMIIGGSHRWTEPFQQLGWIFFIAGFLVLYLQTGREIRNPRLANLAWLAGAVAVVLFLIALILNVASEVSKTWYEAFEAAGSIAMVVTVMSAIWSVGGWTRESEA
jgi:drug/metabolite transporter (DMT)-like permease